jgi:hypothetical protein
MAEDFDADALLAVLDIPEMASAPPHLVEQLRGLVWEKAGPIRLAPATDWNLNVTRPEPRDYLTREGYQIWHTSNVPNRYSGRFAWPDGTSIEASPTQAIEYSDGEIDVVLPIGGRDFLVPLRRARGRLDLTAPSAAPASPDGR